MWIRGLFFIVFALFIDGMQAALAFAAFALGSGLQALTPLGGAAAGAAACFAATSGAVASVVAAGKCAIAGAGISAFGIPLGIGLGMALEICISLTFGFGLIFLLVLNGMYYPGRIFGNFMVEMIPGVDALPGWTCMVIMCLLRKNAEESKAGTGIAVTLAKGLVGATAATGVLGVAASGVAAINTQRQINRQQQAEGMQEWNNPQKERTPLYLKSPRINADIRHAQKAA